MTTKKSTHHATNSIIDALIRASTRAKPFTMKQLSQHPDIVAANPPVWTINDRIKHFKSKNQLVSIKEPGVPRGTYYFDETRIKLKPDTKTVDSNALTDSQKIAGSRAMPGIRTAAKTTPVPTRPATQDVVTQPITPNEAQDVSERRNQPAVAETAMQESILVSPEPVTLENDASHQGNAQDQSPAPNQAISQLDQQQGAESNHTRITLELEGIKITIESSGRMPSFKIG